VTKIVLRNINMKFAVFVTFCSQECCLWSEVLGHVILYEVGKCVLKECWMTCVKVLLVFYMELKISVLSSYNECQ
jgi:hypothetical protein